MWSETFLLMCRFIRYYVSSFVSHFCEKNNLPVLQRKQCIYRLLPECPRPSVCLEFTSTLVSQGVLFSSLRVSLILLLKFYSYSKILCFFWHEFCCVLGSYQLALFFFPVGPFSLVHFCLKCLPDNQYTIIFYFSH